MKIKHPVKNERGSVMMEYIILNFLFMLAIAISGYFFVDPYGAPGQTAYEISNGSITAKKNPFTDTAITVPQYGFLGSAFMQRYRLMLDIVSMPYP